jgi:hypothetical protein
VVPSGWDGEAGLGKSGFSLTSPTRRLTTACNRRPATESLIKVECGRG